MNFAERIEKARTVALTRLPARPRVQEIGFEPYTDSTGDSAVKVTVLLAETTPEKERAFRSVAPIEQAIREALMEEGIDLWPYFWFRTPSEQKEEAAVCS
ncbi:MAG: hypothetical protein HYY24_02645 [Verrucomicrobia bacterium]|nr:hypothetical protein [Verrucomicrobiota bacterium]